MKRNDTTIFFVFILFCIAMIPMVYNFVEPSEGNEITPLFWPLLAVYLGILFAGIAFILSLRNGQSFVPVEIVNGIAANKIQILFAVLSVFYLKAMDYIGFLVASLIMLPAMMYLFGYRKKTTGLVISTTFVFSIYLLFNKVFKIHFPEWALGGF